MFIKSIKGFTKIKKNFCHRQIDGLYRIFWLDLND